MENQLLANESLSKKQQLLILLNDPSKRLESIPMEHLSVYLMVVQETLLGARSIALTPDRLPLLREMLLEIEYTYGQAADALKHFKWGEMKYRGVNPTIESTDFVRSSEDIREIDTKTRQHHKPHTRAWKAPNLEVFLISTDLTDEQALAKWNETQNKNNT